MKILSVKISNNNKKLGQYIYSVSLPPMATCYKLPCYKLCYARRMTIYHTAVGESWNRNLQILLNDPEQYWREVEGAIMMSRYFRWHVGGDIFDYKYFEKMCEIAKRNPHNQMQCFTKKYDIVNKWIDANGDIPKNLHLIFSGWVGVKMDNPYNLPECHVLFKNGETEARAGAFICPGFCQDCAFNKTGCFGVKNGEQIVIKEH